MGISLPRGVPSLVTRRAMEHSEITVPETADRMVARISDIEIKYVRLPMTEIERDEPG